MYNSTYELWQYWLWIFKFLDKKLGRFFTKSFSFKWNNAEPTNIRPTFTKQTCQMTYLKIITSHNQNGFYFKIILWLKNCTICSGKSKFSYHWSPAVIVFQKIFFKPVLYSHKISNFVFPSFETPQLILPKLFVHFRKVRCCLADFPCRKKPTGRWHLRRMTSVVKFEGADITLLF